MIKVSMQSLKAHQESVLRVQRWVCAGEPQLYTPKIEKHRNVQKGRRLAPNQDPEYKEFWRLFRKLSCKNDSLQVTLRSLTTWLSKRVLLLWPKGTYDGLELKRVERSVCYTTHTECDHSASSQECSSKLPESLETNLYGLRLQWWVLRFSSVGPSRTGCHLAGHSKVIQSVVKKIPARNQPADELLRFRLLSAF